MSCRMVALLISALCARCQGKKCKSVKVFEDASVYSAYGSYKRIFVGVLFISIYIHVTMYELICSAYVHMGLRKAFALLSGLFNPRLSVMNMVLKLSDILLSLKQLIDFS